MKTGYGLMIRDGLTNGNPRDTTLSQIKREAAEVDGAALMGWLLLWQVSVRGGSFYFSDPEAP